MIGDRERWNQKWRERGADRQPPSAFVTDQSEHLPVRGRALDVGGGAGRHAVWLAERGFDVTIVDISEVALTLAADRAISAGVQVTTVCLDLDAGGTAADGGPAGHRTQRAAEAAGGTAADGGPAGHRTQRAAEAAGEAADREPLAGPWDVIVVHHFLCRARWPSLAASLAPGGVLLMCQPTVRNLERHASPGARFLVEPDELAAFAAGAGLSVIHDRAEWTRDGRHVAELVARRDHGAAR